MPPADPEPDLFHQAEEAVNDPHPLALLTLASSLLSTLDRNQDPFDRQRPEPPPLAGLLETFAVSGLVAMGNLAAVMAQLQADDLLRTRLLRQLDRSALIPWVNRLDQVVPRRAGQIVEELRDGTNLVIEFVVDGQPLCAVTFVDHNQGGAAKDGFMIPESLDGFLQVWRQAGGPGDTGFEELSVAEVAAAVSEAVDLGAMTWPPYESESWPQARPLVRWLVRRSPAGATGPVRPEWDIDARDRIIEEFLASPEGTPLAADADTQLLVDTLVWYGTDYTYGDPRLLSPVNVEILLSDWMSRKLMADTPTLAKLPGVLRAYVRFAHGQAGVAERLTPRRPWRRSRPTPPRT